MMTVGTDRFGKRIYINHLAFHPEASVVNLKYPRKNHPLNSFSPTANICDPNRFGAWHHQLSANAMQALKDFAQMTPRQFRRNYAKYVAGPTVGQGWGFLGSDTFFGGVINALVLYFLIRAAVGAGRRG